HSDGTVLVWDLKSLPPLTPLQLRPEDLASLWLDLAAADAAKAHQAVWRLASAPGGSIPFLAAPVTPATEASLARARRLVADLDSDEFRVRANAAKELEALADEAAPALREVLGGRPTLEVRRQAERLLERVSVPRSSEVLRRLRAVQVLERIGS